MEEHINAAATSGAKSIALAKESAQNIEEKRQGNAAALLGATNIPLEMSLL